MGGLINGSMVKGDLWMVETDGSQLTCFPIGTTSEGPGPRVGHASLIIGNAFIVFGGDTKVDERDDLDDTLYLLNTGMFSSLSSTSNVWLTSPSYPTVVSSSPIWYPPCGPVWSHIEHHWIETLRVWRTNRGPFLQRSCRL
jgi:hypothetical protein